MQAICIWLAALGKAPYARYTGVLVFQLHVDCTLNRVWGLNLLLPVPPRHDQYCVSTLRGPLGWLVPTEIQPLETRSAGTALNACVNFAGTFLISQVFLSMLCGLKWGVFLFFAGKLSMLCMVLCSI